MGRRIDRLNERQRAQALSNALAFQIWRVASPIGWNMTIAEVAEAISRQPASVANVARARGWLNRFRAGAVDRSGPGRMGSTTPRALDDFFAGPDDLSIVDDVAHG